MGWNTVAVLYNDFIGDLKRDQGRYGPEIAAAILALGHPPEHRRHHLSFGAGRVISQAHADYDQVVIVGQNSGQLLQDAETVSRYALVQMAECLERHGYTVTKRFKPKLSPTPVPSLGGEGREG